ncbi:MAG: nucleotidyltransferase family protein [Fimbriimonadales bacterium]|nr:nucleotidyltransferase family protein [Fimbriimonadales bacterium]
MDREEILRRLRQHWAEIRERFGVEWLAIFGSTARGEARPDSDIDILVRFVRPPGYDGYFALKCYLESLLEGQVDLVMERALKPWARPIVEQEAVYVAEH